MLPYSGKPFCPETERGRVENATRTYCDAFGFQSISPSTLPSQVDLNTMQAEVCYGALYDCYALPFPDNKLQDELSGYSSACAEGFASFPIRRQDSYYVLQSTNSLESTLIDTQSIKKLVALTDLSFVRFEAIIDSSTASKRRKRLKQRSDPLHLSINVFGPKFAADDVGRRLSRVSAFLQHPIKLSSGLEYYNPQFLDFPEDSTNMREFIGITNASIWAQKIQVSNEIGDILDSLADVAPESEWQPPAGLLSVLKEHQEDGVRFILQREDKASRQQLIDELRQVTVGCNDPLNGCYGGVVADVMGLGKTLTMLAAILYSLPLAETFEKFYDISTTENSSTMRSKSTLVVVSSAQLLESWQSEIEAHIAPDAVKVVNFHGKCRGLDAELLASADLVLTTYATLSAEHRGRKTLHQMEWYRIVLDEAHWIRNSTSKQFRAVSSLAARNRWCLTGTPIQNSLNDLASLAGFLRLPLFPTKAAFQKHILGPLSQGGPNFAKPLRAYLRAYCIRRTENRLELPKATQEIVALQLSKEERDLYDQVLDQTRRKFDNLVSQGKTIQRYSVLFTAILRMRMLCNVGTLNPSTTPFAGFLEQQAGDTACERCSTIDSDVSMLLDSFQLCPDCSRPLHLASPYPEIGLGLNGDVADVSRDLARTSQILTSARLSPRSNGLSTKLSAVLQNVLSDNSHAKHIVFSYWPSTLDLLAELFKQAGIEHVQIDGRTIYTERYKRLKAFREDTRLSAILLSIETGAVGLNLTVANRVHVVEPQWNPSVEEQAVARALRMGQMKAVTIFRYIVENTVEESIVNLQQKKKNLARFTFDVDTDKDLDERLEDLKSVLGTASS